MDYEINPRVELSVVATFYNDADIVDPLVKGLVQNLSSLGITYEIILVDDGSIDHTEDAIKAICLNKNFIKALFLSRNFGQQVAMSAGLKHANGNFVVAVDGDLENPLDQIPVIYHKIKKGYDIVYTVSSIRQSFSKKITSALFWFFICNVLKIRIVRNQLMLRIMSRKMIENFNLYRELNRSIAGINYDIGLKSAVVEVTPNKRPSGKSNYNFYKRLNMFLDIVLNMSLKPLNFIIFLGVTIFIGSILLSIFYLYRYFMFGSVPGYTSLILSTLFLGSIIIFTLGIMSRYLSLIYFEVRTRPLFILRDSINI